MKNKADLVKLILLVLSPHFLYNVSIGNGDFNFSKIGGEYIYAG